VTQYDIDTEESYPWNSGSGTAPACSASSGARADIQVVKHIAVESDEDVMAAWVTENGPLSINIDALTSIWWSYTDDIVFGCSNIMLIMQFSLLDLGKRRGRRTG